VLWPEHNNGRGKRATEGAGEPSHGLVKFRVIGDALRTDLLPIKAVLAELDGLAMATSVPAPKPSISRPWSMRDCGGLEALRTPKIASPALQVRAVLLIFRADFFENVAAVGDQPHR
jgi:hypothetical protein